MWEVVSTWPYIQLDRADYVDSRKADTKFHMFENQPHCCCELAERPHCVSASSPSTHTLCVSGGVTLLKTLLTNPRPSIASCFFSSGRGLCRFEESRSNVSHVCYLRIMGKEVERVQKGRGISVHQMTYTFFTRVKLPISYPLATFTANQVKKKGLPF